MMALASEVQYSEGSASLPAVFSSSQPPEAGGSCTVPTSLPSNSSFRTASCWHNDCQHKSSVEEEREKGKLGLPSSYCSPKHPVVCSFHASGLQLRVLLRGSALGSCRRRSSPGTFLRNTVASSGLVVGIPLTAFWQFQKPGILRSLSPKCVDLLLVKKQEKEGALGVGKGRSEERGREKFREAGDM